MSPLDRYREHRGLNQEDKEGYLGITKQIADEVHKHVKTQFFNEVTLINNEKTIFGGECGGQRFGGLAYCQGIKGCIL